MGLSYCFYMLLIERCCPEHSESEQHPVCEGRAKADSFWQSDLLTKWIAKPRLRNRRRGLELVVGIEPTTAGCR